MPIYESETIREFHDPWLWRGIKLVTKGMVVVVLVIGVLGGLVLYYSAIWYDIPLDEHARQAVQEILRTVQNTFSSWFNTLFGA